MFELRPAAKEQLDIHFTDKDKEPIRIYLASGCGGQRLSLALDERKDDDQVFEAGATQIGRASCRERV